MNYLYRLSQNVKRGYDTFDSCIVCAPDAETASNYHPCGILLSQFPYWQNSWGWARRPEDVLVERIGIADESTKVGVICSSFNAG